MPRRRRSECEWTVVSVVIPVDDRRKLEVLARQRLTSISDLVRQGIRLLLEQQGRDGEVLQQDGN